MDANEWWHGEGGEEEQPWEADAVCEEPQCKDGGLAELDAQDRTDPKDSKESASVGMPWKEDTWESWGYDDTWVEQDHKDSAMEPVVVPTEPNAETHMEPERADPSWDQNATGDNAWANSTWVSCKADSTWGQDSWGQDSWGQDSWDAGKHDASYDKADKEITEAKDTKDKVKPPVVLRRYSSKGPPSAGLTNTEKESPIKWGPIKNAKLALGLFCVQGVEDQPDDVGTLQVKWWDDDIINKLPELTLADHIRFVKSNFSKFEQVKNWQPTGLSQDLFATLLDIAGLVFKQGVQDPAQIVRRFCCCMFSSLRH